MLHVFFADIRGGMTIAVLKLSWLTTICACASGIMLPSWWNFDRLRRGNCTKCADSLEFNLADVLPRLTRIKQKILNTLGKDSEREVGNTSQLIRELVQNDNDSNMMFRIKEIVCPSEPERNSYNIILKTKYSLTMFSIIQHLQWWTFLKKFMLDYLRTTLVWEPTGQCNEIVNAII